MKATTLLVVLLATAVLAQDYNRLIWSDEFNGGNLDLGKWEYEVDCWGGGNNEQQCYTARRENVRVENGNLILQARVERYQGTPGCTNNNENSCTWTRDYTSGRVHSKFSSGASWQYGRFETRARLPRGAFLWPAIWMLPSDQAYGGWAASGEIDIMEARGQEVNIVEGTLHFGGSWPNNVYEGSGKVTIPGIGDFSADWHNFQVIWRPSSVEWSVDGRVFRTATLDRSFWSGRGSNPYRANRQPFDRRFHFILNLAVGGGFFGGMGNIDVNTARGWPKNWMEIDYVRVFGEGSNTPPPVQPPPPPPPTPVPNGCNAAGGGTGSGLLGHYFSDRDLRSYVRTNVDPTIAFDWGLGSPGPNIPADFFSIRWEGQIQTRYSGPTTFHTVTDDGIRLWVNNVLLIDDWRDHGDARNNRAIDLIAGIRYPFKVEFYDATANANIFVRWSHPCSQTPAIIPAAQLYPVGNAATVRDANCYSVIGEGKGLKGEYYNVSVTTNTFPIKVNVTTQPDKYVNNTLSTPTWSIVDDVFVNRTWTLGSLAGSRVDPQIDFAFNDTVIDGLSGKGFFVKWVGFLQPVVGGSYVFYTDSSNGVKLTVNGQVLIDNMVPHSAAEDKSKSIILNFGISVPIQIEFLNLDGEAKMTLHWEHSECIERTVVPGSQLYEVAPPPVEMPDFGNFASFLAPVFALVFALLF
eukprot:TRINITY_DN1407_c0_g1_i1.p1 TRINITY_DN1407_c0_g1~~TRINITY_DN1407_c0_g1_i1.p1  ORF type:complete len:691 (+),score=218.57 TRINITY_DN1407_c0_g1_i1:2113-4185(+)